MFLRSDGDGKGSMEHAGMGEQSESDDETLQHDPMHTASTSSEPVNHAPVLPARKSGLIKSRRVLAPREVK